MSWVAYFTVATIGAISCDYVMLNTHDRTLRLVAEAVGIACLAVMAAASMGVFG